jgi:hypothetical protein
MRPVDYDRELQLRGIYAPKSTDPDDVPTTGFPILDPKAALPVIQTSLAAFTASQAVKPAADPSVAQDALQKHQQAAQMAAAVGLQRLAMLHQQKASDLETTVIPFAYDKMGSNLAAKVAELQRRAPLGSLKDRNAYAKPEMGANDASPSPFRRD